MTDFFLNDFYCMNCGQKIMSLPRTKNRQRSRYHRKRMYCPWCKMECNAVECRDDGEVYDFKTAFENGEFKEELAETLIYVETNKNLIWS